MIATLASSFLPVNDTAAAAAWYGSRFGLESTDVQEHAAVLRDRDGRQLTLMGPASGIPVRPGLAWAPVSFRVEDVAVFREESLRSGAPCSPVQGDPGTCLFVTVADPDGNTVLVVDR
ncbi:VOC family protein [Paenibacillus sp. TRM 82003]|uniref:VOC family protein n=1 Tax=Kineococcus sp. TRM81007 TaxID=2925831 RepID=UPI001F560E22|nr:VOC family protein [Kineococcus sp. TRM81007]MCI2238006.1 VOC family protein [Kineococcus sp. TRM81007]MCI3926020.1 VOC family protein [Paenibacillus sp. TRM 82003]